MSHGGLEFLVRIGQGCLQIGRTNAQFPSLSLARLENLLKVSTKHTQCKTASAHVP